MLKKMEDHSEVIYLTPEMAAYFLTFNDSNRRYRDEWAEELARRIRDGEWKDTKEGIHFDYNGRMINGQHRCNAIIKYGKPVKITVHYGCDPEVQEALDTGRPRTGSDVLDMKGFSNTTNLAATARIIFGEARGYPGGYGMRKMSNQEMLELVTKTHPDLHRYVLSPGRLPKGFAVSKISFINYVGHVALNKGDDTDAFINVLCHGADYHCPARVFRERALDAVLSNRRMKPHIFWFNLKKAYQQMLDGRNPKYQRVWTEDVEIPGLAKEWLLNGPKRGKYVRAN